MKQALFTLAGVLLLGTAAHCQAPPPRIIVPPVLHDFTMLDVVRVPFITETGDLMKSQARRDAQREDWLLRHPAPLPHEGDRANQLNWDDPAY